MIRGDLPWMQEHRPPSAPTHAAAPRGETARSAPSPKLDARPWLAATKGDADVAAREARVRPSSSPRAGKASGTSGFRLTTEMMGASAALLVVVVLVLLRPPFVERDTTVDGFTRKEICWTSVGVAAAVAFGAAVLIPRALKVRAR